MKMNRRSLIIVTILAVVLLAGGAFLVAYEVYQNQQAVAEEKDGPDYDTFSDYTKAEAFAAVPLLFKEGSAISEVREVGQNVYSIQVDGTTKKDYEKYLKTLEKRGYKKHSDNGEEGMDGYVYTATFQKDETVVTVYHLANIESTSVTVSTDAVLSEHLIWKDAYETNLSEDAKTRLHMVELADNGNSFVIQLKNGHFVVEDGGNTEDAPYLLDYLESLTPTGQKPVIEGWFITHAHEDHIGALKEISNDPEMSDRIYVDGIYFVDPSGEIQQNIFSNTNVNSSIWFTVNAAKSFVREDGSQAQFYRPSLGQRYYFCDMTIDITLTIDQIVDEAWYSQDFNDSSTWLMHTIEGQRFLHAGDAAETTTRLAMDFYDKDYFDVEVFAVLHHGINVFDYFTDYCTIDTLLYTSRNHGSMYTATWAAREEENEYLKETAAENLSHGDGTVILAFPYKVGSSENAPLCDWRYDNGERPGKIWDVINGRKP